jgi:hypothetical protein
MTFLKSEKIHSYLGDRYEYLTKEVERSKQKLKKVITLLKLKQTKPSQ